MQWSAQRLYGQEGERKQTSRREASSPPGAASGTPPVSPPFRDWRSSCCLDMADVGRCRLTEGSAGGRAWKEEEAQTEDQIDGQQLHPFEPVGPAVPGDLAGDEHRQQHGED